MYYLLYQKEDEEAVQKKILPELEGIDYKTLLFAAFQEKEFQEKDIILTYLDDEALRKFLPIAGGAPWQIGVLPHPQMEYVSMGLGIPNKLSEVIQEITETTETHKVDLLYCNENPVFQSVNIGEVFELVGSKQRKGMYRQLFRFVKQLRLLPSLRHRPFSIFIGEEKVIDTSALGIIAVEHSKSSLISKKLVRGDISNDGLLYLLILAPQNILELIWFLLKSLLPGTLTGTQKNNFIGLIKSPEICLKNSGMMQYTIDGKKMEAEKLHFKVDYQCLTMAHPIRNEQVALSEKGKKSMKIEHLPKGEKRLELTKRKLPWFRRATYEEFKELFLVLKDNAELTNTYLVMMVLSTLITAFGLYADSSPVIIGAMILAPLISPIVSFSMGLIRYDIVMLKTSLRTILFGTIASLIFAAFVSLIIPLKIITSEIDARLTPSLLDLGIAVASGVAAAFAHAKEGIAKSLAGVAIAVALVPPLAVAGIGIGWLDWEVFSGAFLLYLTNLSGIIMFGGLTFLLLGFSPFKRAKKGLLYSFLILLLVCVPLSFSFYQIKQEAEITRALEGVTFDDITLREVKVRSGNPPRVSLKIVAPKWLTDEKLQEVKKQIQKEIGMDVTIEIISALEF